MCTKYSKIDAIRHDIVISSQVWQWKVNICVRIFWLISHGIDSLDDYWIRFLVCDFRFSNLQNVVWNKMWKKVDAFDQIKCIEKWAKKWQIFMDLNWILRLCISKKKEANCTTLFYILFFFWRHIQTKTTHTSHIHIQTHKTGNKETENHFLYR